MKPNNIITEHICGQLCGLLKSSETSEVKQLEKNIVIGVPQEESRGGSRLSRPILCISVHRKI